MDGSKNNHVSQPTRRRRLPVYDVLWKRIAQAVGLVIAVAEFSIASVSGRPVDQNVLLFAAMLIGAPLAARRGSGDA